MAGGAAQRCTRKPAPSPGVISPPARDRAQEHCRGGEDGQQTGGGRTDGREGCGGCSGKWEPDGPGPRGPEGTEVCAHPPGGHGSLSDLGAQEGHGQPCVLNHPAELERHFFVCFFWSHLTACGISVSLTRDQTCALAKEAQGFSHWTTREVPVRLLNSEHVLLFSLTTITNFKKFVP